MPLPGVVFALCSALAAEVLRAFRLMELEATEGEACSAIIKEATCLARLSQSCASPELKALAPRPHKSGL